MQVPRINVLFLKILKTVKFACNIPITVNTVKSRQIIKCLEGRSQATSVLTLISDNLDSLPGTIDTDLQI